MKLETEIKFKRLAAVLPAFLIGMAFNRSETYLEYLFCTILFLIGLSNYLNTE